MNIIKNAAESRPFKIIMSLIAILFITAGISGVFQSDPNTLAEVDNISFTRRDLMLDQSLRLQNKQSLTYRDFHRSLHHFALVQNLKQYGLVLTPNDLQYLGFTPKDINNISDISVKQYLLDQLPLQVIKNTVNYTPNNILANRLNNLLNYQISLTKIEFQLDKISPKNIDNTNNAQLSEEEALKFYKQNSPLFYKDAQCTLEYTLFKAEDLGSIEEELANDVSFNEIINKYNLQRFQDHSQDLLQYIDSQESYRGYVSQPIENYDNVKIKVSFDGNALVPKSQINNTIKTHPKTKQRIKDVNSIDNSDLPPHYILIHIAEFTPSGIEPFSYDNVVLKQQQQQEQNNRISIIQEAVHNANSGVASSVAISDSIKHLAHIKNVLHVDSSHPLFNRAIALGHKEILDCGLEGKKCPNDKDGSYSPNTYVVYTYNKSMPRISSHNKPDIANQNPSNENEAVKDTNRVVSYIINAFKDQNISILKKNAIKLKEEHIKLLGLDYTEGSKHQ